jgi:hypothetical protein
VSDGLSTEYDLKLMVKSNAKMSIDAYGVRCDLRS